MSSPIEVTACAGFGTLAGIVSGFLGIGGGLILPPLLVFVLGFEQHRAQGISLAALLPPVGLPAVLAYRKAGVLVDVKLVTVLVLGFAFGGVGGAWAAQQIPARQLGWCFAAYLAVAAWHEVRSKSLEAGRDTVPPPATRPSVWRGLPIGLVAGVASGLLGIGGGLVALPLLRRGGHLGRLEAQATTLALMLPPIGLPAVLVYAREQGSLQLPLLGAVAAGFALGSGAGAHLAGRVNERTAARIYAGFLVVTAAVFLVRR